VTRPAQLPDKLFFKIGEVADIVGVKPHVLRYWETEFPALRPMKTRGSHRIYSKDVELAMFIRRLLHDEGYTIPGARKRLRDEGRDRVASEPDPHAAREVALRAELLALREELVALTDDLDEIAARPAPGHTDELDAGTTSVTVTAVVPSTVKSQQPPR
jgi:DNA-binding transcriptional MerR regulator